MDATWSSPAVRSAVPEAHANPAVLGLLIGAAVPALVASTAWWLDVPLVAVIAAVGVPIGAFIGAATGPRLTGPRWVSTTVAAALAAPLVVAAPIAGMLLAFGVGTTLVSGPDAAVGGIVVAGAIIGYAEVVGVPVTLPVAVVVAILVRRASTMGRRRATVHVGVLVTVAAVASVVTLVAMTGAFGATGAFESVQVRP